MSLFSKNVNKMWVGGQQTSKFDQHSLRMTPYSKVGVMIMICVTRKYPLPRYILGMLTFTTALGQYWEHDEAVK